MRSKLATPAALACAAVVFVIVFLITRSLLWAPALAAVGALGLYLMLDDRSPAEVTGDDYAEDADRRVEQALRHVQEIGVLSRDVASPTARRSLQQACEYVPELLKRVKATAPNSLYSSASQLDAHLASLHGVVTQYLDMQRKPEFYPDPQALMRSGEEAFQRFTEFAIDSVRLVGQGDMAEYKANLDTVAPPKLPELT